MGADGAHCPLVLVEHSAPTITSKPHLNLISACHDEGASVLVLADREVDAIPILSHLVQNLLKTAGTGKHTTHRRLNRQQNPKRMGLPSLFSTLFSSSASLHLLFFLCFPPVLT
jgi:hypothetical protein